MKVASRSSLTIATLCLVVASITGCQPVADNARDIGPSPATLTTVGGRDVDIRVWWPGRACDPCDAIVFSHGNNLAFDQYDEILEPWAEAGYLIVAPLHVDSESHPDRDQFQREQVFKARLGDIDAIVTALASRDSAVVGNVNWSGRWIAAGHSYGALMAQVAGGASFDGPFEGANDHGYDAPVAVVALSPPGPIPGYIVADGWETVAVPQVVVTGTTDFLPEIAPDYRAHLISHDVAPSHLTVGLVFDDMDHYFNGAFGRLKPVSPGRDAAIEQLNRLMLDFVADVKADGEADIAGWNSLEEPGVEPVPR